MPTPAHNPHEAHLWDLAKQRAGTQYGLTEEDGPRYERAVNGLYQKLQHESTRSMVLLEKSFVRAHSRRRPRGTALAQIRAYFRAKRPANGGALVQAAAVLAPATPSPGVHARLAGLEPRRAFLGDGSHWLQDPTVSRVWEHLQSGRPAYIRVAVDRARAWGETSRKFCHAVKERGKSYPSPWGELYAWLDQVQALAGDEGLMTELRGAGSAVPYVRPAVHVVKPRGPRKMVPVPARIPPEEQADADWLNQAGFLVISGGFERQPLRDPHPGEVKSLRLVVQGLQAALGGALPHQVEAQPLFVGFWGKRMARPGAGAHYTRLSIREGETRRTAECITLSSTYVESFVHEYGHAIDARAGLYNDPALRLTREQFSPIYSRWLDEKQAGGMRYLADPREVFAKLFEQWAGDRLRAGGVDLGPNKGYFTGEETAWLYPRLETALRGRQLLKAFAGRLVLLAKSFDGGKHLQSEADDEIQAARAAMAEAGISTSIGPFSDERGGIVPPLPQLT